MRSFSRLSLVAKFVDKENVAISPRTEMLHVVCRWRKSCAIRLYIGSPDDTRILTRCSQRSSISLFVSVEST